MPTVLPSQATAARMAAVSIPRAPPETTLSPEAAQRLARSPANASPSAPASRDPTTATPPPPSSPTGPVP